MNLPPAASMVLQFEEVEVDAYSYPKESVRKLLDKYSRKVEECLSLREEMIALKQECATLKETLEKERSTREAVEREGEGGQDMEQKLREQQKLRAVAEKKFGCVSTVLHEFAHEGMSLLHIAVKHGMWQYAGEHLSTATLDINMQDTHGNTVLHYTVLAGDLGFVEKLIEAGADVTISNEDGDVALHWAARSGSAGVVGFLLDKAADINCRNKMQHTPLWLAARSGYLPVVQLLCERGARLDIRDSSDGDTPMDIASRWHHEQVFQLLAAFHK